MESYISRAEHEEFTRRMEDEHGRMNKRLEILEKNAEAYGKMAASVERLATNMESMVKEQERQGERLDALEQKPADNWNTIVRGLLTGLGSNIAALLLGALAAMYFLK